MSSKEDYWEWDKKSLTAADYSVELYVEEIYKEYLKENGQGLDAGFSLPV